jgi:alpha-tubulin suppressor-like RCC1 family protein
MAPRQLRPLATFSVLACLAAGFVACSEDSPVSSAPNDPAAAALAQVAAPSFLSVSAGWDHSCGITTGTRAYCWGNNRRGQLGTLDKDRRLTPTAVSGDLPFEEVEAANFNSCGVTTEDKAYCWGQNLPNGTYKKPVLVDAIRFVQVTAELDHFCGLTAEGKAYCRGANGAGQLGDGTTVDRSVPVAVAGGHTFRQISTSTYHTCAVTTDDRAFCWGDNVFGQLGDGNTGGGSTATNSLQPVAVTGGLQIREISAGNAFTCALTTGNRVFCWGSNIHGQLGDETVTDRPVPTAVHTSRLFLRLDAGNSHVCAVSTDDRGFCWGRGAEGQLGNGVFDVFDHGMKPQAVRGGLSWRVIAAGGLHSCGVTTTDVAYCWGNNGKGQLGDGTQASRARPAVVAGAS